MFGSLERPSGVATGLLQDAVPASWVAEVSHIVNQSIDRYPTRVSACVLRELTLTHDSQAAVLQTRMIRTIGLKGRQ